LPRFFFFVRPAGRTHLEVQVLYTPGMGKCQPNGKGVAGDCESGGSRRQSAGLTNRKRIEAVQRGEQANICEARYMHGTLCCISDRHKHEGECVIPGEI
jgi:hypothetical protein